MRSLRDRGEPACEVASIGLSDVVTEDPAVSVEVEGLRQPHQPVRVHRSDSDVAERYVGKGVVGEEAPPGTLRVFGVDPDEGDLTTMGPCDCGEGSCLPLAWDTSGGPEVEDDRVTA